MHSAAFTDGEASRIGVSCLCRDIKINLYREASVKYYNFYMIILIIKKLPRLINQGSFYFNDKGFQPICFSFYLFIIWSAIPSKA